ncbi:MAG: ChaN family lipoprotein [Alphaproteobacteria bacterium]|nr:ChaN family lipoprotein [Alphaproteobacteria bacterium]
MRHFLVLASFVMMGGCALSPPEQQTIWLVGEKRYISESDALERMAAAPLLLLGESHDNQEHHRLQAHVVKKLADRGQTRALAFEMIERDRQPVIDAHLAKQIVIPSCVNRDRLTQASGAGRVPPERLAPAPMGAREPCSRPSGDESKVPPLGITAESLGQALDWDKSGWPDFALYAPVFQAGLDGGWPIRAANLPKSLYKAVGKAGGLDAPQEARLGLDRPLPPEIAAGLRQNLIDSHCGLLPETALPAMMRLQTAWDGAMALTMTESLQKDGVVLIAGSEHARLDRAVPLHLARLLPEVKRLAVAFKEQTDPPTPPESEDWPFDLIWFTPPTPTVDHCAQLKERMKKKKGG